VGQEVFVRLHAALGQFRGEASVRTYILRIAMNLSLNALRARRRRAARFTGAGTPEAAAVSDQGPAPDATIEQGELQHLVALAIARLPDNQREVVVRRLLHERSTRETAEALGVPEGTVLSRLSRGLTQLRRDLGHLAAAPILPRRDPA
jgi:RNA polymerase sigma-70 factor (ECF subfamily)